MNIEAKASKAMMSKRGLVRRAKARMPMRAIGHIR